MTSILVVDDDALCAEELAEALSHQPFPASWSDDPLEALEFAALNRDTLRIVITDLCMDGMNGYELISELNARNPELGFVVVTSHSADLPEAAGEERLILGCLPKPVCVTSLISLLRDNGL